MAVSHGVAKMKRKTARAVIDHITQVLPGPDEDFVQPLLQDYTKAFLALLDFPANVESFAVGDGDLWLSCLDFCLLAISRSLEKGERLSGTLSRASPAPGTGTGTGQSLSLAFSTGRSSSSAAHRGARPAGGQMAENYLSAIRLLVSAPQPPLHDKVKEIFDLVIQVLQARHAKLSTLHQTAFAVINGVLSHIQAENLLLAKSIVRDLVPLLAHWWPQRALLRDAMSNAVRDEMLKTLYRIQSFLESLVTESPEGPVIQDIEDLLDVLWTEYSRREERARLQLDDLTFTSMDLPQDHPRTNIFGLCLNSPKAEQNWALLEAMSLLESLYLRSPGSNRSQEPVQDDQPRKRRRVAGDTNRILQRLTSSDPGVRLTTIQLIPFLFQQGRLSVNKTAEVLELLLGYISDKQGLVASWAMLACSRYRSVSLLPLGLKY